MDWIQYFAQLAPILAVLAWVYNRIDKRFDKVDMEMKEITKDLQMLDSRVARIEGHLFGGYWEPKIKEKGNK